MISGHPFHFLNKKIWTGGFALMTHIQQNLSSKNAFTRFMLGSMMTAYGTAQLMRDPKSRRGQMLVLLGSMKAAEGATRFCPTKAMTSNMMQKITGENATQNTQATSTTTMNSGKQNAGGSIKQMVGNIVQNLTGGNIAQNGMGNSQSTASAGQTAAGGNIAQTLGNIAQTVAPQVGQMMNGAQNASGATNEGKQATSANGTTNAKSTENGKNKQKENAANKNKSTKADSSVISASAKTTDQNAPTANILQ